MLDVHPPPTAAHGWRDFLTHLATIVLGLLIAVGLEQSVEYLHHRHQRERLEADLAGETQRNLEVVHDDLGLVSTLAWFERLGHAADRAAGQGATLTLSTPRGPCVPGQVGNSEHPYLAPIDSVWTTARESDLVQLLPLDVAHAYARLAFNVELLTRSRDAMANACDRVYTLQSRFAVPGAGDGLETWTLTPAHGLEVAAAAAAADTALRALLFRLQVLQVYLDGVRRGERNLLPAMMALFRNGGVSPPDAGP